MQSLALLLSVLLASPVFGQTRLDLPTDPAAPVVSGPPVDPSILTIPPDETLRDALANTPPRLGALSIQSPLWPRKSVTGKTEEEDEEVRRLKTVRLAGGATAGAGAGLLGYALAAEIAAGPIGWATALIFFGGMSAYLAQRRLDGHEDFSWQEKNP